MKKIEWLDGNRIKIEPPKRTKKITGTRFASILGKNRWSTPFEMWCAITKTYEEPFEDTIYTLAGKAIEPKQADYMESAYGMKLIRPTDIWGKDYFNKTWGDFFPESEHLGGMWDFLATDEDGNVKAVLEMKTSKRVEDWQDDIPEYYAMQAALYAYLLNVDYVIMVASFLEPNDYENPDTYQPSWSNTITREFKLSERYPNFNDLVQQVENWWNEHVTTGISPQYDEKKDADILKALRTNTISPDTDIDKLIQEAESLEIDLNLVEDTIRDKKKRLKDLNDEIKSRAIQLFRDGDTKVEIGGRHYNFIISKSVKSSVDKKALVNDGLLDRYTVKTDSYRMTVKRNKDDK